MDAFLRPFTFIIILFAVLGGFVWAAPARADTIPLKADLPVISAPEAIPVSGGIPFPKGALKSIDNIRILDSAKKEIPCQVTRLAVWPDGSVKWALIDIVVKCKNGGYFTLEYGAGIKRKKIDNPLTASLDGGNATVSGGVSAVVSKNGGGVLDSLSIGGKTIIASEKPARLVVNTIRIKDGTSAQAFPVSHYVFRGADAKLDEGKVQIDKVAIESPGPIRATILVRGHILLPNFGATLPEAVMEPTGKMPFSMRLSFYKGSPVVYGQHQIIFSGEPDCDYIARWGIELPGQAGPRGQLILEPGVQLNREKGKLSVAKEVTRLSWAPVKDGFGLIRKGWYNRPCAVTQENGSAWIDFWPQAAGVWDLRRYAREWAVGETGPATNQSAMEGIAKYAARGIAKSHNFLLYFGKAGVKGDAPEVVKALSGRGLLLATPAWYGASGTLGGIVPPEQTAGDYAGADESTRLSIDYHLYNQDLFRWHGKLVYGFWQTRFGVIHRYDRWDRDYGRWGWSLNDGSGRVGHMLMLAFLRTLERRYFDAGEAFGRINYDTSMIHTLFHIETDGKKWWQIKGCTHRHNVQPFGCPYTGLRGSNPGAQRIVHLLTGDGVIADGLDIVAQSAYVGITSDAHQWGHSGGSDGKGSGSNALLWKYETTGDKKYLDVCREVIDSTGLIPPSEGKRLGYGPSFGLFNAAGEYALISGDKGFQDRVVELAKMGADAKDPGQFLYAIAIGYQLSNDQALKDKLTNALKELSNRKKSSLIDLPTKRWPGHAGWRKPYGSPNSARDYPYALGVLVKPDAAGAKWPVLKENKKAIPAEPPVDWYRPGGIQTDDEKVPAASVLLRLKAGKGGGKLTAGEAEWGIEKCLGDTVKVGDTEPLASGIIPYVQLTKPKGGDARLSEDFQLLKGEITSAGKGKNDTIVASGKAGPASFVVRLSVANVDGVDTVRAEVACKVPEGNGRVASWGLFVPLKLSGNGNMMMTTAPGRFRLERTRLDQNDERIPEWLTSEYRRGKNMPAWPKWRESGIQVGPGKFYRIWKANRRDTSPLYVDQGKGAAAWFDLTDRGASSRWGVTVRVLRPATAATDTTRRAIRANFETGLMEVQFHDAAAEPLNEKAAAAGLSGAADIVFHDGWRPPFSKPELTQEQYEKFIDDLSYGENYGLFALRFRLSATHKVKGREWPERIRDLGVEPREFLYCMQRRDGLKGFCEKIGVKWDPDDLEGSVKRVIEHYKK